MTTRHKTKKTRTHLTENFIWLQNSERRLPPPPIPNAQNEEFMHTTFEALGLNLASKQRKKKGGGMTTKAECTKLTKN